MGAWPSGSAKCRVPKTTASNARARYVACMTIKDNPVIGLKEDAPFRKDNLPESQKSSGGPQTKPGDPTRSAVDPKAIALYGKGTRAKKAPRRKPDKMGKP